MGKKSRKKKEKQQKEKQKFNNALQEKGDKLRTTKERACVAIIRWGVYFALITPLVVHNRFFFPFVGPKGLFLMGLVQIIFFTWLFLIFYFPKYRPQKNPLLLAIGAFVAILTLATIFGADPSRSFWSKFERMSGLLMWFHLLALFLVASTVFRKRKDWLKIFAVSVFIACIVSILFLIAPGGASQLNTARSGSTLGNSSFLATYLLFNLYFAIFLFFSVWKKILLYFSDKVRNIALAVIFLQIILMFWVLFKCGGEAAFFSFLGGLGLLFVLWWASEVKRQNLKKAGKAVLAGSILVFVLIISLLYVPGSFVQERLIEARHMARPLAWQKAWQGFLDRPILGWGPQNYTFPFDKYFDPCFYVRECGGETRFDQAHNIIMDNLVDGGTLGLLGYFSILGSAFFVLWKNYFRKRVAFWTAGIFTVLLVAHFTQNLMVFDMPASFLMLFLTLGFIGSLEPRKQENKNFVSGKSFSEWPTAAALLVVFVLCFNYFIARPVQTGTGLIRVVLAQEEEVRKQFYEQTLGSSSMGIYQARTHLANNLLERARKEETFYQWEIDLLINELEKSIESAPKDYYSLLTLGSLYNTYAMALEEKAEELFPKAEQTLKQAINFTPTKQAAYWKLAENQAIRGKEEEAIKYAQIPADLEPRFEYAHFFLLQVLDIFNKTELLEEKVQEAIGALPESAPKFEQFLPEK